MTARDLARPAILLLAVLSPFGLFAAHLQAPPTPDAQVQDLLRERLEPAGADGPISIGDEVIHASTALPAFYERRVYMPAWTASAGGRPLRDAYLESLRAAGGDAVDPRHYHLERIEALLRRLPGANRLVKPRLLADLDLLLTDSFLILGAHLVSGRVDPETFDPEWVAVRKEVDLGAALEAALESGSFDDVLAGLLPREPGYARLKEALGRYRRIAAEGGFPPVPDEAAIRPGDTGPAVAALRRRLAVSGDLEAGSPGQPDLLDAGLERAVERFQSRHGLGADGVAGKKTLQAMNVPASARVRQIELNMERWKWLPRDLGDRYLIVNTPAYDLRAVEEDKTVLELAAVVGRPYRRTPVFSDTMRYMVLNPAWEVPHKLAVEDKLPILRKDPDWAAREGMHVYEGWGSDAKEIDPATVDWSKVTRQSFKYRLRQDPGPANALGRIKFMFPNKFNVYLHDTPARELFAKEERSFSSGCIRVEKPLDLAVYLMRGDPRWTREALEQALDKESEFEIRLPRPLPVHILYWTAWAEEDGRISFRNDVYGRDARLEEALSSLSATAREAPADSLPETGDSEGS